MMYWIFIEEVLGLTSERRLELGLFLVKWQYILLWLLLLLPWCGKARTQWIRWLALVVCIGVVMWFAGFCWVYVQWPVGTVPPQMVPKETQLHFYASMAIIGGAVSMMFAFQTEPERRWKKILGVLLSLGYGVLFECVYIHFWNLYLPYCAFLFAVTMLTLPVLQRVFRCAGEESMLVYWVTGLLFSTIIVSAYWLETFLLSYRDLMIFIKP